MKLIHFLSLMSLFCVFSYSNAKEHVIIDVTIYPPHNYPIAFLCTMGYDTCIQINNVDSIDEIVACFEENTFLIADYIQIDDYYRISKQENKASVDSFISGTDLYSALEKNFKSFSFYLADNSMVKLKVAVVNSEFKKSYNIGSTSLGIDSDYFLIPYNFKYARAYDNSIKTLICVE